MVEINNQRKAFLDMLAWSEGTMQRTPENQKSCYDVIVGGELFTDYSDHPRKLVTLNPKLKFNRRWTPPASFPLGEPPTASSLAWKTSLRKVRTLWHYDFRDVALYLWLIVWYPAKSTVAAISGLHCRALVMVSSSIRLTMIAKFKEVGGTVREIDEELRVTAIIYSGYLHHRLPVMAVNHYRDNAITYKAQRWQKCQRTEAGERGNYRYADASAWCCCARCKIQWRS